MAIWPTKPVKLIQKYWPHAAASLALLAVFAAYTQPEFLVTLANQVWACF